MQDKENQGLELQKRFFKSFTSSTARFVGASLSNINIGYDSAARIAEWCKNPKNFLILTGPPGTGKTYICAAILAFCGPRYRYVRYYEEKSLLSLLRGKINDSMSGDYSQYLQTLIDDEFILIDDVGSSSYKEFREDVLTEIVDFRYCSQLPTVITTNLSEKDFYEIYHPRIASRLFAKENCIIDMSNSIDLRTLGM